MRRTFFCYVAVCAAACTGAGGVPAPGGPILTLRAEERVVIPSMTIVTGIAVSDQYVFIATPAALGMYDRQFGVWLPPFTRVQGWPATAVTMMMADPADIGAVWFAVDNVVYHHRVTEDELVRAIVPVRVTPDLVYVDAADAAAGLVVRTGTNSYMRVSPNGFAQPMTPDQLKPRSGAGKASRTSVVASGQIVPQTVQSVFARFRSLQDYQRVLTQDAALRSWPLLSAAAAPTQSEVWMGSGGGGLFKVDPLFVKSQQVPFGLLSDGAGAVALAGNGVWIGGFGLPGSPRDGITFTDDALRTWRWIDGGSPSFFTGVRVTGMSQYASTLWVATDRGVMRVDAAGGGVERVWDGGGGIPLSIVATAEGAWVGTTRTLSFVRNAAPDARRSTVEPMFEAGAIKSLALRGDTLWIGGDAGALVLPPGETKPRRLHAADADVRLNQPVDAIVTADSIAVIATAAGDVLRINVRTGGAMDSVTFVSTSRVGRVNAMALDAQTLWIAGERGVLVVRREGRSQQFVSAAELGGEPLGVVVDAKYGWIAAREGAVRLERTSDGMLR